MELIISTHTGLEDTLIHELKMHGFEAEKVKSAKVRVKGVSEEDCAFLNYSLRTANRVFYLIEEAKGVQTLKDVYNVAFNVDWQQHLAQHQTFAVRGKREGKHEFTSVDIAKEVGTAVNHWFQQHTGKTLNVNLTQPDVEIVAELSDDHFLLLLNTSGEYLGKRFKRVFQHFAPIKTTLAAGAIYFSERLWKARTFLDPMAGGGTIPIEVFKIKEGIYPQHNREVFAFHNLLQFKHCDCQSAKQRAYTFWKRQAFELEVMAADVSLKNVEGMKANVRAEGAEVTVFHGDARTLNYVKKGEVDVIITNPPYGIRMGNPRAIKHTYYAFANSVKEKKIEEVVSIVGCGMGKVMASAFEQHGYVVEKKPVLYGKLWVQFIKATRS